MADGADNVVLSQSRLARATARGLAWMYGATAVQMAASLGAQLALGWLLSDRDFGLYAIAIGASVLLQSLRDGGARIWLVQEKRAIFERWVHAGFALTLAASVAIAALIAAASPLLARLYGEPELTGLLLVIAGAIPVGVYAVMATAELQSSLRFVPMSKINLGGAVVRHGLVVLLAALGFGPYSFVLPLFAYNAYESVAGWWVTRYRPQPVPLRDVVALFRRTRWVLTGTALTTLTVRGDYLALGLVASTSAIGVYYFAYSLAWQVVYFAQDGLRKVLMPALARAREAGSFQYSVLVGVRLTALLAASLCFLMVVAADDIEAMLWRGRWEAAVPTMQIMAAAFPVETLALLSEIVLMAAGRFRGWSLIVLLRGAGLVTTALVGGRLFPDEPAKIAAVVAIHFVVVNGLLSWRSLNRVGVRGRSLLGAAAAAYALAAAAALAAVIAANALFEPRTFLHLVVVVGAYAATIGLLGAGLLGRRIREMWARLKGA